MPRLGDMSQVIRKWKSKSRFLKQTLIRIDLISTMPKWVLQNTSLALGKKLDTIRKNYSTKRAKNKQPIVDNPLK